MTHDGRSDGEWPERPRDRGYDNGYRRDDGHSRGSDPRGSDPRGSHSRGGDPRGGGARGGDPRGGAQHRDDYRSLYGQQDDPRHRAQRREGGDQAAGQGGGGRGYGDRAYRDGYDPDAIAAARRALARQNDPYERDRYAGEYAAEHGADPYDPEATELIDPSGRTGPGGPGGPGGPPGGRPPAGPGGTSGPGKKARRRKIRKIILLSMAAITVLMIGLATTFYLSVKVPTPNQLATAQISTITYADGTPMAKIGTQNRTEVKLDKVPEHVRYAVIAAENRTFYSDPGISVKGVLRAAWNNVHGGELQGGSSITQQYVKNAFLTQEKTFSRKTKELAIAIKLSRSYSKDQILEWYLNTIYFGRGAYGIQAAAETYFGKPVDKLTVAEGAVLAASIRSPALYDPQGHPEAAKARWTFVIDGMASMGKLGDGDAARLRYPKVRPRSTGSQQGDLTNWNGLIMQQVKDELARNGVDEAALNAQGLRVVTTIDRTAESAAVNAVKQVFAGQPSQLRQALVAVEPSTGRVLAYYGGSRGDGFDYAQAWRPPGSSFKPIVFATALQQTVHPTGDSPKNPVGVYTKFDGTSPRNFPGVDQKIRNSGDFQCPNCTVLEAMTKSVNTVFYDMAIKAGPSNVAALAHQLGVPTKRTDTGAATLVANGVTDGSIGIGRYEVRPIDQASAFGAFADGGRSHQPYFVQKVMDNAGHVLYEHQDTPKQVLDPKVANDVTFAMEPVAEWSHDSLAAGRKSASKTGTQQYGETKDNSDAWMVGFTPQVSAAVWVGTDKVQPIRTSEDRPIFGAGLPGKTWQAFMDSWLNNRPQEALADEALVKAPGSNVSGSSGAPPSTSDKPASSAPPSSHRPKPTTRPTPTSSAPTSTPPPDPTSSAPPTDPSTPPDTTDPGGPSSPPSSGGTGSGGNGGIFNPPVRPPGQSP